MSDSIDPMQVSQSSQDDVSPASATAVRSQSNGYLSVDTTAELAHDLFSPTGSFVRRHIGPSPDEQQQMLAGLGCSTLDALIEQTIPQGIRSVRPLQLGSSRSEYELLGELRAIAGKTKYFAPLLAWGITAALPPQ